MKHAALTSLIFLAACGSTQIGSPIGYEPIGDMPRTDMSVPAVMAKVETAAVESSGDAADDPAFWVHPTDVTKSLVLGTDKQAGLYSYDLEGNVVQFVPSGALNNVDVRQGVRIGDWTGDLAAASNRSDNTVTIFTIEMGQMTEVARFPAVRPKPYGFCMGYQDEQLLLTVTHKKGEVDLYRLEALGTEPEVTFIQTVKMQSQLEGCVFDEEHAALYVGEENAGISRFDLNLSADRLLTGETRVDVIGGETDIAADIEGLTLYRADEEAGYLIASSQGNNTYAVYNRQGGEFLGRFRVAGDAQMGIDGTEDTDGIHATSIALPGFPKGVLLVQDGFNMPKGSNQNYKYVDWRDIEAALGLE